MSKPIINLKDVSKIYVLGEAEVRALDRVSLTVEPGEFISVEGPSGCGKTTLLSLMGCLAMPTSGRVLIDGTDVTNLSEGSLSEIRCRKIGFVFQFFNLISTLSALENVELPMIFAGGMPEWEVRDRALELLDVVGLADRANHRPTELSGGEQQRVAMARALANDPSIVLADEPTGNLDSRTGAEIVSLMSELNRETGKTFVVVTHDPIIASSAEKILYMRDGRLYDEPSLFTGSTRKMTEEEKVELLEELGREVDNLSFILKEAGSVKKPGDLRESVLKVRMGMRRIKRRLGEI